MSKIALLGELQEEMVTCVREMVSENRERRRGGREKEMAKVRETRGMKWWDIEIHTCRLLRKDRQRIWVTSYLHDCYGLELKYSFLGYLYIYIALL